MVDLYDPNKCSDILGGEHSALSGGSDDLEQHGAAKHATSLITKALLVSTLLIVAWGSLVKSGCCSKFLRTFPYYNKIF